MVGGALFPSRSDHAGTTRTPERSAPYPAVSTPRRTRLT
jgi:hypothetical protein